MVAFQEKSRLSLRSSTDTRGTSASVTSQEPGAGSWKKANAWVLPSYYISAPALEAIIQSGVWLCKEPMHVHQIGWCKF